MTKFDKRVFMETVGFLLAQEFAIEAPKDSGTLAKSFPATMTVEGSVIKFRLPKYAEYVINGSAPHVISVKDKKILAVPIKDWKGKTPNPYGSDKGFPMLSKDGKFVLLGKRVNHPGNKPNPFLQDTINRKLQFILKQAFRNAQR